MRKYQRKLVGELREIYQSKDVLRWLYLNQRMGGDRIPTRREMRILMRRIVRGATRTMRALGDAFRNLSRAISGMGASMRDSMQRMGIKLPEAPLVTHVGVDPARVGADRSISQAVLSRTVANTQIMGRQPGIVILDEAMALDDDVIDKINEIRGAGDGTAE